MAQPPGTTIARQIAGLDLFAGLDDEALQEVARRGRVRKLQKGALIFTQGVPAERCHALISGRVRIAQSGEQGGQVIARFVGPGETFGTLALFTDRRYPAEASVVTDSVEISWPEPALLELIHRYPRIALNLVKIAGARLREAEDRLRELATQRVEQRIAHALLRLAERNDAHAAQDGTAIGFPLTRQDLAQMCGATLYTVSRVLTAWEKTGYISTRRRQLTILKVAQIRQLATEPAVGATGA